ncbi:MAG: MBL fold metallo-hydrolase [Asticcacaulis sp.]
MGDRGLSWQVLRVGACRHPEILSRRRGHICPIGFPALVGLIHHPTFGAILFDTGYAPRFFTATEAFPERLYRWATPVQYGPEDDLVTQLDRLGLKSSDIRAVIVSHFHGDHVAGLADFAKAQVFCARAGYAQIQGGTRFGRVRRGLLKTLVPESLKPVFFEDRPLVALPAQLAPFDRGVDVFGDGSLMAVELPGHCAGHWGLWVGSETEALFIGDAAWSMQAIVDDDPPPAFTTGLLGDTKAYRRTLKGLAAVAQRLEVIPSHCEVTARKWVAGYGV